MKKILSISMTMILGMSVLSACSTKTALVPAQTSVNKVQTMSATTLMSMNKTGGTLVRKSESTLVKDKADKNIQKTTIEPLQIKVDTVVKNYMNDSDIVSMSRYGLTAMNSSSSYQAGYQVGYDVLNRMERDGVFIASISAPGVRAAKSYEGAYKVTAAALNYLASGRENTPVGAISLVEQMMAVTTTYEDEYRVGYEALNVIGQADNQTVKLIVSSALRSAAGSTSYTNGSSYIKSALTELKRSF